MTPATFELDYELKPEDLNAWTDYWCAKPLLRSCVLVPLAILVGGVYGLLCVGALHLVVWLAGGQWDPVHYWLYVCFSLATISVMLLRLRRDRGAFEKELLSTPPSNRLSKWQEQFVGCRRLTVSAEGFKVDSPVGSTSRKWSTVTGVHSTDSHVFVVADCILIVPRNAFSTETERDEFVEAIEFWRTPAAPALVPDS